MEVWLGIALVLALFLIGSPIFAALGLGAVVMGLWAFHLPPANIGEMLIEGTRSYTLLAVPLYIWMGELFLEGGGAKALVRFIELFIGRVHGGLGMATVVTAGFFAAISASGSASIATVGLIMIPEMINAKYDRGFAGAIVASSGTLGNLIPPSLFFIMYGALCEVNVAMVFAAGLVPGMLGVAMLSATAFMIARGKGYERSPRTTWAEKKQILIKSFPAVMVPIIVLGSIYAGIATPTEAGSVAAVYTLLLGFFVYRGLNLRKAWEATKRAVLTTGTIMIMVAAGILIARMFVLAGFPRAINAFVMSSQMGSLTYLLLAGIVILILGTFMETVLMLYVCVPLFYSTAMALGVPAIHFGVLLVVGIIVGQTTPPMAESIFIASSVSGVPSSEITKHILPFAFCLAILFYLTIIFPEISLWLPRTMGMVIY